MSVIWSWSSLSLSSLSPNPNPNPNPNPLYMLSNPTYRRLQIQCAKRSQRTGKLRYPSEKKRLRQIKKDNLDIVNKCEGFWRLSKLGVDVDKDPGKDFLGVSDGLLEQIAKVLQFPVPSMLPVEAFSVVRKSFDARKFLKVSKFVYSVDVDVEKLLNFEPRLWDFISKLQPKVGLVEHMLEEKGSVNLIHVMRDCKRDLEATTSGEAGNVIQSGNKCKIASIQKPKVAVVGSGPSGLFAALVLGELGADVTLIERGQPVEQRGRDIGALVVRRIIQSESNFCFGEGGAGTWSDGKLVTRIGKNGDSVQAVLRTLVHFGAPRSILVDGKPHLGTDRLIPLLRNFRQHLQGLGVRIKFGTRVDDLLVEGAIIKGVKVSDVTADPRLCSQDLKYDAVVLAVGHSARDVYQMLLSHNVDLVPKDFAIGLRIEHPQELINSIQYAGLAAEVNRGRGKVPVADYKIANYLSGENESSYGSEGRGCYSFCMCPGGQVVLTSTNPTELCVNGMSFSKRSSKWANAALVVTVSTKDFETLNLHGPLAGVAFQKELEQRAAIMGGGNFVVPVQLITDFLENKTPAECVPSSSYRLGVKAASLHELFPAHITKSLQDSILMFEKELPGFISKEGLLHGVETRTSSPVQVSRSSETYESTSLKGLYPVGEGAGYAGGIVSAAVDGMYAGFALAKNLGLFTADIQSLLGKPQTSTSVKY